MGRDDLPTMPKKAKRKQAATLDELHGSASELVKFIRTDARAIVIPNSPSLSTLKAAMHSPFEPHWSQIEDFQVSHLVHELRRSCVNTYNGAEGVRPRVVLGLRAVMRSLKRGELRAVICGTQTACILHLAQLAFHSRERNVALCGLPCSPARLGQPFGLLRVSCLGLPVHEFPIDHRLIVLISSLQTKFNGLPILSSASHTSVPKVLSDHQTNQDQKTLPGSSLESFEESS